MKFANKLFFAATVVLAIIFTAFGVWMLSSYFRKTLEREIEQADAQNQMFQLLFVMAYQSAVEYGEDYAIRSAAESVAASLEKSDNRCFVWSEQKKYFGEAMTTIHQSNVLYQMGKELEEENTYAYGIRCLEDSYYLLSVSKTETNDNTVYLGISKDITDMYEDRNNLLNQYRFALVFLLIVGGICIYILSQYITRPIRELDVVVEQIAAGNYEKRSKYISGDEIGKLSNNFNHMADCLMEQMQAKEMEAKQKESFTAAFAHELKTPLTSIIGYADMLNSITMTEEECREAYYYIFTQGKRLENLAHKLLEMVSVEQTDLQVRMVQTKELEENIRNTMRPVFHEKNIKGKIMMEKGIIYGDRDLLLSVFYNLLDNAVKAVQEENFILLKGVCVENGYEIKVVDNGRGIPKEEIGRITEAFYMVDKSRSRKEGGAGIGMALCQRIIALHKGTLQIHSKLGEGTIIQLWFPKELETK